MYILSIKKFKSPRQSTQMKPKSAWTTEQEQLLVTWAEKASGYAWLHNKSIGHYKNRNLYITIPASLFAYIAGATSFLSSDTDDAWKVGFIGICSILAGVLTNFQEIFTFKELSEQHRISSLRFLSFFRDISCELSLHSKHRTDPIEYITLKRMEFDKMLEQTPTTPQTIIKQFNAKFKDLAVHKPDVAINLQTILPYGAGKKIRPRIVSCSDHELKLLAKYFYKWLDVVKSNQHSWSTPPGVEIANSDGDADSLYRSSSPSPMGNIVLVIDDADSEAEA